MSHTLVNQLSAVMLVGRNDKRFFLLMESMTSNNVDPYDWRLQPIFFGDYAECCCYITGRSAYCETGDLKTEKSTLTPEKYITQWSKALSNPATLHDFGVFNLNFGVGINKLKESYRNVVLSIFKEEGVKFDSTHDGIETLYNEPNLPHALQRVLCIEGIKDNEWNVFQQECSELPCSSIRLPIEHVAPDKQDPLDVMLFSYGTNLRCENSGAEYAVGFNGKVIAAGNYMSSVMAMLIKRYVSPRVLLNPHGAVKWIKSLRNTCENILPIPECKIRYVRPSNESYEYRAWSKLCEFLKFDVDVTEIVINNSELTAEIHKFAYDLHTELLFDPALHVQNLHQSNESQLALF